MKPEIAILDFGSQYTQLIARKVRENGVYAEIYPFDVEVEKLKGIKGIILSGGPKSVWEKDAPIPSPDIFKLSIPILGICYGMQLFAHSFKGKVSKGLKKEYGPSNLYIDKYDEIFEGVKDCSLVWMSHGDKIDSIPHHFICIAHTSNSPYAAIRDKKEKLWAFQFHPEVYHTRYGKKMLKNFTYKICHVCGGWTMKHFVSSKIREIKKIVGKKKVLCALSGGVDSSVVVCLLHKAIGKNAIPVFVNNGLLRKNEEKYVRDAFKKMDVHYVDASHSFLKRLRGVEDPEKKRIIIGEEFINVFYEVASMYEDVDFLAQGTLYPDVIESRQVKGPSARIKTHHNVGGLPGNLKFRLVEPLKELFKDEVRKLGKALGLPESYVNRQPFPGPGLAVRIIGEVTNEKLDILRNADDIIIEEIKKAGFYNKLWQSFAILLPTCTVGVMGDKRTYNYVIAMRAVESEDGMTADWAKLPHEFLSKISTRIINEVSGVNRVVYDISSKPPATIEWE
ncbi:MAG: glutamine-hydrolyzing GMP synthase [Deltaproteobacteria bacterium]|nr:glutamine-hydrolyzing GMP synthase [Deltaproteobacteria bacterium]